MMSKLKNTNFIKINALFWKNDRDSDKIVVSNKLLFGKH